MKKLIPVFLLMFSINGYCEWKFLGSTTPTLDNGFLDNFVDYSTKKINGSNITIWGMSNLRVPKTELGITYQSFLNFTEYDCKNSKVKVLSMLYYSEQMGKGKVLKQFGPFEWIYLPPNSYGISELNHICGIR